MFARPPRGRSYNNFRGSARKNATLSNPRGLFADGVWHCDCKPRLPAERFQVKKEGKNKGKWFYTCQQDTEKRCGFFLWADEAQRREAGAVLSNSRTEPHKENKHISEPPTLHARQPMHNADDSTESEPEPSPSRRKAEARQTSTKRTAQMAGLDQDDEFDDDFALNAFEVEALVSNADSLAPETPVKGAQNTSYATPATTAKKRRLPWQEGDSKSVPAQPMLRSRIDELLTPAKTPQAQKQSDLSEEHATTPSRASKAGPSVGEAAAPVPDPTATTTPDRPTKADPLSPTPPQRYFDALADPDDSGSPLVAEVFAELSALNIAPEAWTKVRSILSKHELKTQGILKGRDITRVALKGKDATIGMLQNRIRSLETQLSHQRASNTANKAAELRK